MPITGQGWEMLVTRLGIQQLNGRQRTYGTYQVYRNGQAAAHLNGNICESRGPGDLVLDSGHRILHGRYPLCTQFGEYRTVGYSTDINVAGKAPMPAIALDAESTRPRDGILIHPGHPPDRDLFLSSIGCLNPTKPLVGNDLMDFWDSRSRVVALIDDLKVFAPRSFATETTTPITNAWIVIDGEPNGPVPAPQVAAR